MERKTSHRAIVHFDLDAFYCSVEILKNPFLKNKPVVVGGIPENRGVVAAASYLARSFGIHSAMPMARALTLCPQLIVLPPNFKLYRTYSMIVMGLLKETASKFQQISIDEAYIDLTDDIENWNDMIPIAKKLQKKIIGNVGLSVSLGLATSKLVAKVASDYKKPSGFTVVPPGKEKKFLEVLNVRDIPGIGQQTAKKLEKMNITKVADFHSADERIIRKVFGSQGAAMLQWANGIDTSVVSDHSIRKSISTERTFSKDIDSVDYLRKKLRKMSDELGHSLKDKGMMGKRISIKLRYFNFETISRQKSLAEPTAESNLIYDISCQLLDAHYNRDIPVRLIGVGITNLVHEQNQLTIFDK
jgi:DNA polymerase-4